MYGVETWALKKAQEKKLEVAEMRMLRWMCGVTKLDKVKDDIKEKGLSADDVYGRATWRHMSSYIDPT